MKLKASDWRVFAENARHMALRYREMADEPGPEERREHLLGLARQRDVDAEYYDERARVEALTEEMK